MSKFDDAYNAYKLIIEKAPDKSVLYAYLYIWPQDREFYAIPIDNSLAPSFLWHPFGRTLSEKGNDDAAMDVYDGAIQCYKDAISNKRTRLLWQFEERYVGSDELDVFDTKEPLPEAALWAALGESYKAKGDNAQAVEVFLKAAAMQPNNTWLQRVIGELEGGVAPSQATKASDTSVSTESFNIEQRTSFATS